MSLSTVRLESHGAERHSSQAWVTSRLLLLLAGVLATAACLISPATQLGWPLYALPAVYALCVLIFPRVARFDGSGLGSAVLKVSIVARYVAGPVVWSQVPASLNFPAYVPSAASRGPAVWLMVAELLLAAIMIQFVLDRRAATNMRVGLDASRFRAGLPVMACILAGVLLLALNPEILKRYRFFLVNEMWSSEVQLSTVSGVNWIILIDLLLVLVPLVLVASMHRSYLRRPGAKWVVLSVLVVLPALVIFRGTSRMSAVVPALAWLSLLPQVYPAYRRKIRVVLAVVLVAVFTALTLSKQFGYNVAGAGAVDRIETSWTTFGSSLNVYLAGPGNMATGMDLARHVSSDGVLGALRDLMANIVGLSQLVDSSETTSRAYNSLIYGDTQTVDQIVPLTIQSLVHFGVFGCLFFLWLALMALGQLERVMANTTAMDTRLALALAIPYFGMSMLMSVGSVVSALTNVVLPLLIVLWLNRKLQGPGNHSETREVPG